MLEPNRIAYNSFQGRFSDNPRAIYEELARRGVVTKPVWMAREPRLDDFPGDAVLAAPETPELLREVGSAKYIVSNVEMRENLVKQPGMVFLQTWHGTPLKRIGYDNRYVHANPARFEVDVQEYVRWDYLLSPNRWSSDILVGAFRGFEGEVIESGWPRNDALFAPDRDEVRARVRRSLGVEDDRQVVLYAPTWRDNLVYEQGADRGFSLALDLEQMAARLGDDHALLLRVHFLASASLGDVGGSVLNVSAYSDIRDLYLAADVLITDYSSVMFDFAITGKPMLFYAYDLEDYRDRLRGFYFDFEPEAPGPLCRTTDEVISVLEDLDASVASCADRYARFREKYCYLDDGRASARVVEKVFPDLLS